MSPSHVCAIPTRVCGRVITIRHGGGHTSVSSWNDMGCSGEFGVECIVLEFVLV